MATTRRRSAEERDALMARIVAARRSRTHWNVIAKNEGLSIARVRALYQKALARNPLTAVQVDEHRLEHTEMADTATKSLLGIAVNNHRDQQGRMQVSPRTRVEAWNAIKGWHEYIANLLGLKAPAQLEITTIDALDAQISQLRAELAAMPEPDGPPLDDTDV